MNTQKIIHISHNDLDGYGCTILTNLIIKGYPEGMFSLEEMHIIPSIVYKTVEDICNRIDEYDKVIITDIAINKPTADLIQKSDYNKFIWIDHHECKIPEEDIKKYDWLTVIKYIPDRVYKTDVKVNACATWLYYKFILSDPVFNINILQLSSTKFLDHFAETVRMYDTYEFTNYRDPNGDWALSADDAPRLNTLFHTIEHEEFSSYIHEFIRGNIPIYDLTHSSDEYPWISKVLDVSQLENDKYVKAAMKKAQFLKFDYLTTGGDRFIYNIALVCAERNGPAIGNALCVNNPTIDFAAVVTNNQVSIYTTKEDVDVSKIAIAFHGGGHKKAAGFTVPYSVSNRLERIKFEGLLSAADKYNPDTK